MEVLKLFAPYGPGWLGGAALALIAFYFGKQFLEEYKRQNERKGEIDLKREERKQDEVKERAIASGLRWRGESPPRWSARTH